MTTKALLEELHHLIDSKKDNEAILQKVYDLLKEDNEEGTTDWWDEMTEEQRAEQELADEDLKEGKNFISHEEALKRMDSWLKK